MIKKEPIIVTPEGAKYAQKLGWEYQIQSTEIDPNGVNAAETPQEALDSKKREEAFNNRKPREKWIDVPEDLKQKMRREWGMQFPPLNTR